jgi:hypothetical protein
MHGQRRGGPRVKSGKSAFHQTIHERLAAKELTYASDFFPSSVNSPGWRNGESDVPLSGSLMPRTRKNPSHATSGRPVSRPRYVLRQDGGSPLTADNLLAHRTAQAAPTVAGVVGESRGRSGILDGP